MEKLIADIVETHRRRVAWHKAEKALILNAKAQCRRFVGGDKDKADKLYESVIKGSEHELALKALAVIAPLIDAADDIREKRLEIEKVLASLAKKLPVAKWLDGVSGFSYLSLAGVIGAAGDLSNYENPAKLWKRMGLAVMGDGQRQRKVTNADEAIEHGYSPVRRSLVWVCGECIVKAQIRNPKDKETKEPLGDPYAIGPLGQLYLDRKAYLAARDPDATKKHIHLSAKRYVEKRLIRNLWRAWRACEQGHSQDVTHTGSALSHGNPDDWSIAA